TLIFLACVTTIAVAFCVLLLAPFLKAIVFAAVLAIIFYPIYVHIRRWCGNRNVAAAISTVAVAVFIATVSLSFGTSISSGLRNIYRSLSDPAGAANRLTVYLSQVTEKFVVLVSGYVPISVADLHSALSARGEKVVSSLLGLTATMAGSAASVVVNAAISLFILFFLFRDGHSLLRRLAVLLPMARNQVNRLYDIVRQTLNAIVYGTLMIAAIQGFLTGLGFWFVGITSPALWGVVTALCALLPVIGTGFVVTPALLYLVLTGHWVKALLLGVWALVAVHPVDNLLRPYLIGEKTNLSTLYVFFALLGGFEAFGALGLFLGPVILAVTLALLTFLRQEMKSWKQREGANVRPMIQ
ncbi:MAG: AI-2E family transporter, partial [Terracidiphilus sp.]